MNSADARLLRLLRAGGVHTPPSELSSALGLDRAALEQAVGALRGAGFLIDEVPGLGYRLAGSPDRLVADDLWSRLEEGQGFVREIIVFAETDSTNDRASQLGRSGAAGGVAVFAERQRAGRGRFGRRWESASQLGIWFSILLRPAMPLEQWPRLTTWAAVAVAAAVEAQTGCRAEIKWPNDVCIGGAKVAGILIETGQDEARAPFAVVGIGVNVNHVAEDFPPELREKATSLRAAAGAELDRAAVAAAILAALGAHYSQVACEFDQLRAAAARRSSLLGRWVRVCAGENFIEGTAEGLDAGGQLLIRCADGNLRALSAGEASLSGLPKAGG